MATLIEFADGGFSFLHGVFPYSQGVVARPDFAIERARFARPVAMSEGFRRIGEHLASLRRPLTALCACELRSPRPFSFSGFGEFNQGYVAVLEKWGLYRDGLNPVARSNVAPEIDPPTEPSFYAFSYTVPVSQATPSFVSRAAANGRRAVAFRRTSWRRAIRPQRGYAPKPPGFSA